MLKFINSLATIEVNKELEAVRIILNGYGDTYSYMETLRMATGFANLHHVSSYFLIKDNFEDVNYRQFHSVIGDWLYLLEQHFNRKSSRKTKVAVRVNREAFLELSQIMHKAPSVNYYHVLFDLFFTDSKAHAFLKPDVIHA